MKILQINNCHYRRGGADVVYLNTYELLRRKGHDVKCFSSINKNNINFGQNNFFTKDIKFFNINLFQKFTIFFRFFYSIDNRNKIKSLLKLNHFDIAHVHTYKGTLTPSILLELKKHNIPIVFTAHDYGLMDPHNALMNGRFEISENTINKYPFYTVIDKANRNSYLYSFITFLEYKFNNIIFPFEKNFKKVICVSKFSFNKHLECNRFNFNLEHLYNFIPNLNKLKTNPIKGKYFLYSGRLSVEKGIMTLLNSWENVENDIILKIAGDGPLREEIIFFIKEKKMSNIQYVGFKQKNELFDLILNSSFQIVPSECYENNPLAIIESYAMGKPVIASNIGGIPEIVKDNQTGFLFEMKNLKNLSNIINHSAKINDKDYLHLSKNSRKFAQENFSEDVHYLKLMTIYSNLILENEN